MPRRRTMSRKVVITRSIDGSKKIIVGTRRDNTDAVQSKTVEVSEPVVRRAKPPIPKVALTKEKNAYKYGGKSTCK